jgi:hypothetical protein
MSAEHSSINDIMQNAQHVETTMVLLKIGKGTDKATVQ